MLAEAEMKLLLLLFFFAISLSSGWSDLGVNFLGCPLLGGLLYYINIGLNTPEQQTSKTFAFIWMVTLAKIR